MIENSFYRAKEKCFKTSDDKDQQSSLDAVWVAKHLLFLLVDREAYYQSVRMRRQIWIFAERIFHCVDFALPGSFRSFCRNMLQDIFDESSLQWTKCRTD